MTVTLKVFVGHCPNREVYQAWHDIPSATGLLKAQKRCGADLHQRKGYEPNALRPRNCAMAFRRVQSVPGGGMVNPFWSTRAREEARVQALRPADLPLEGEVEAVRRPVPGRDEEVRMELEGSLPIEAGSESGTARGRSTSRAKRSDRFRTPASWLHGESQPGMRSAGRMPLEGARGEETEGPFPRLVQDQVEMDIERMLEKELVQKLHEENLALKHQVASMMNEKGKGQGSQQESSSWSEVTVGEGRDGREGQQLTPRGMGGGDSRQLHAERRYTPGGTQVPMDTPPDGPLEEGQDESMVFPPVPPWPWEHYDKEHQNETVKSWLGPVSPRVGLHDHGPGGGRQSRQEQGGRGMESRHGLCQGGIESRQGQGHSDGSFLSPEGGDGVLTASEARTAWLERELLALRGKMEAMQKVDWSAEYWGNPFGARTCPGGDRASHGSLGLLGGDLASHGSHGLLGGDRARQGSHFLPGGDRAQHESHGLPGGDQSRVHDLPGGDRAQHGSHFLPGGDRAQHGSHGLPGGDRVQSGAHDLLGGDRAQQGLHELSEGVRAEGKRIEGLLERDRALREDTVDLCGEVPARGGGRDGPQQVMEVEEKDTLKATTVVLPSLPSVAGKDAGLACGDWLAQVRPLMGDIAVRALIWWDCVVAAVTTQYYRWLEASPLDRLRIAAPNPSDYNTTPSRQRMELRASAIILAALPGSLKDEVISSRQLATGKLLYKILRVYQPGGVQERAATLSALTGDQVAKTPKEAVDLLRRWRRHQLRAIELRASLPDPSLMIRSLSRLVETILGQAPQALFRVNSYRLQSKLDVLPSEANLEAYYDLLLAEMETLALSPESVGATSTAGVRMMQNTNQSPNRPDKPGDKPGLQGVCRNWGTSSGCRFGKQCRYEHPVLPDQKDRCWVCSSTEHIKSACPYKPNPDSATGGSGGGGGTKGGAGKSKGGGNQPKPKPTLQMEVAMEEEEEQDKQNRPIPNQSNHRWLHYNNQKRKENLPTIRWLQVEKVEKAE